MLRQKGFYFVTYEVDVKRGTKEVAADDIETVVRS